jgi:PhnB protein
MEAPGGKVAHAELAFGDSVLMLTDEFPESGATSPKSVGGTPVTLSLYVDDVDDIFRRAIAEGATKLRGVEDQFYGDRSGSFEDPFGHRWYIATHIEDVPPDEMAERSAKAMSEL